MGNDSDPRWLNEVPLNDPMQLAAAHGHIPIMELFLENGVDINDKDVKGHTALFTACENDQKAAALWLIDKGADVDDHEGWMVNDENCSVWWRGNGRNWSDEDWGTSLTLASCMDIAAGRSGWADVKRAMEASLKSKAEAKKKK